MDDQLHLWPIKDLQVDSNKLSILETLSLNIVYIYELGKGGCVKVDHSLLSFFKIWNIFHRFFKKVGDLF